MKLPLPTFNSVKEVVYHEGLVWGAQGSTRSLRSCAPSLVLIAPDLSAGKPKRYSVIRVMCETGRATCIGRELDLKLARVVAARPKEEDGKPVKQ